MHSLLAPIHGTPYVGGAAPAILYVTAAGLQAAVKCHFSAAVAPAVTDDSSAGYAVGSWWFDTTADKVYVCVDAAAGAAVWIEAGAGVLAAHAALTTTAHGGIVSSGDARLTDARTPLAHSFVDATGHTAAGLTTGHFLKATGATTYGFAAHGLTYSDVGAAASGHDHSGVYQPADADLTAIAALTDTGGWAKRTAADTWSISTPTYSDVGAAAAGHNHAGVYDPAGTAAGAVSSHASLTTGVHGLNITAGQTLTVTTGGTLGSAAYTAATDYATAGHTHAQLHDAVTLAASATDVLALSTQALSAVDAGSDMLLFWDESANKLTYLTVGTGLSITATTITATATAPKLDDCAAPDDNTDLNATTTAHGLLLKATAPAAGLVNFVGISNGETVYANKALFDTTNPAALGVAAPGTAVVAARRDHVHASPTETDPVYVAHCALTYMMSGVGSRSDNTISVNDSSPDRTFTIAPTGASFDIYCSGVKYTKTSTTQQIANSNGLHYVYFDSSGNIGTATSAWDISSGAVPLAMVQWNTAGTKHRLYDERHLAGRVPLLHEYLHETRGAAYASGGAVTPAANGSTHTVAAGEWYDEEFEHAVAEQTQAILFYRTAVATWNWTAKQAAYFTTTGGAPAYDNAGTLTAVDTAKFSMTWVYWCGDTDSPVTMVVGQGQYATRALAEAVSPDSLTLPGSLGAESKLLYRHVWQRNGAAITYISTADYRRATGAPGAYVANDHQALSNLAWANSGHTGTASYLAGFDTGGTASYVYFGASVTDVLTLGSTVAAVDAGADKIVFWDESANKLTYATVGGGLSFTTTVLSSTTVANDAIWDAKGDLAVGTAADTSARLAVGTNGKVLVAASGETTGLKWAYLPDGIREYQPTAMQPLEAAAPGWEVVDFGTVVATVASFDDTAEEYLNGKFVVPATIDTAGTVTFEVTVSPKTGAASKNVGWTFGHAARATGEAVDSALTEEDSGAKSITATTGQQTVQTWTETVSNLGWSVGDTVYFRLSRDPTVTNDLTGDCYLLMFRVLMPTVL